MNPVFASNQQVLDSGRYVHVNTFKLDELAKEMAQEALSIPSWNWPPYPGDDEEAATIIDYFGVQNAINFAFTDFEGKGKWTTEWNGKVFRGSTGQSAAIWRAHNEGVPILDGAYLATMTREDGEHLFRGNFEIPMLDDRVRLLNDFGTVLTEHYQGRFSNFIDAAAPRAFGDDGIVTKLVTEMPTVFEDSYELDGRPVQFWKRAQLLVQLLHGRFQGTDVFPIEDVQELSVPADYVVPKANRDDGVTEYAPALGRRVDNERLIPSGSRMEIEIRAAVAPSMKELGERISAYRFADPRLPQESVYGAHIDAARWMRGRKGDGGAPHHLTVTTDY